MLNSTNSDKLKTVTDALAQIRLAENALDDVIATTVGTEKLRALAGVYNQLTCAATSLIRAQTTSDDNVFNQVKVSLKVQADALKASEASIQEIIKDAEIVGNILGYITEAVALIATL